MRNVVLTGFVVGLFAVLVSGMTCLPFLPSEPSSATPDGGGSGAAAPKDSPGGVAQAEDPEQVDLGSLPPDPNDWTLARPVGFTIALYQGVNLLFEEDVWVHATDNLDGTFYYKIVPDYDQATGLALTSIYLSIHTEGLGDEVGFKEGQIGFYIRAASSGNPHAEGINPLLELGDESLIDVVITDLRFEDSVPVSVYHYDTDAAAGMYMMQFAGWYYWFPDTLDYDADLDAVAETRQVPQSKFLDATWQEYVFVGDTNTQVDVAWRNMISPVYVDPNDALMIGSSDPNNLFAKKDDTGGKVFELAVRAMVTVWQELYLP